MCIADVKTDPAINIVVESLSWSYIIVHHSGAEEKDTEQIRKYHKSLGWLDIGYHYVVERDGKVVEGRPLTLPGAHCDADGMNFKGIGVCLIGNFEDHQPTQAQIESLNFLILKLRARHKIGFSNVLGHKMVKGAATLCPGVKFEYSCLRPWHYKVNDRIIVLPTKLINNRTEVLINNEWIHLASIMRAIGANVIPRYNENSVDVIIY